MKKLHFKTTEQFEELFKRKTKEVSDAIVESIQEALENKNRTAHIFEITFDEGDVMYEISLPKSQWKTALQKCLDHYHELEFVDEQIDTWNLIESIKNHEQRIKKLETL